MSNIIEQINKIKEYTDKTIKIPFTYLIFGVDIFLICNIEYISFINATGWVPDNIRKIILNLSNALYANVCMLLIILVIIVVILSLLASYTSIARYLPKSVEYTDGTILSWNEYSAIARIINIIIRLVTTWWIYYFSINILFNQYNYAKNFFLPQDARSLNYFGQLNNELINAGYISIDNLWLMNAFFWINVVLAVIWIVKALFEIRTPTSKYSLKYEQLESYIILNSFEDKSGRERYETILLKTKYSNTPQYLLVKGESTRYRHNIDLTNKETPKSKRTYKILNISENLSEIQYHFEVLKGKIDKN